MGTVFLVEAVAVARQTYTGESKVGMVLYYPATTVTAIATGGEMREEEIQGGGMGEGGRKGGGERCGCALMVMMWEMKNGEKTEEEENGQTLREMKGRHGVGGVGKC